MMRFTISIFSFVLFLSVQACKSDTANQAKAATKPEKPTQLTEPPVVEAKTKVLSAEEFDQYIQNNPNIPLIDLRTPEQYANAHIGRAINIPYVLEGFADKVKHLRGAGEVLIYDENGIRSARAAQTLEKMEIGQIKMLDKGIYSWAVAHKMQVSSLPAQKKK